MRSKRLGTQKKEEKNRRMSNRTEETKGTDLYKNSEDLHENWKRTEQSNECAELGQKMTRLAGNNAIEQWVRGFVWKRERVQQVFVWINIQTRVLNHVYCSDEKNDESTKISPRKWSNNTQMEGERRVYPVFKISAAKHVNCCDFGYNDRHKAKMLHDAVLAAASGRDAMQCHNSSIIMH